MSLEAHRPAALSQRDAAPRVQHPLVLLPRGHGVHLLHLEEDLQEHKHVVEVRSGRGGALAEGAAAGWGTNQGPIRYLRAWCAFTVRARGLALAIIHQPVSRCGSFQKLI